MCSLFLPGMFSCQTDSCNQNTLVQSSSASPSYSCGNSLGSIFWRALRLSRHQVTVYLAQSCQAMGEHSVSHWCFELWTVTDTIIRSSQVLMAVGKAASAPVCHQGSSKSPCNFQALVPLFPWLRWRLLHPNWHCCQTGVCHKPPLPKSGYCLLWQPWHRKPCWPMLQKHAGCSKLHVFIGGECIARFLIFRNLQGLIWNRLRLSSFFWSISCPKSKLWLLGERVWEDI